MRKGLNHNATRAQGYDALTTKIQRSIIAFAISIMIVFKDKLITSFQEVKTYLRGLQPFKANLQKYFSNIPLNFFLCVFQTPL